MFIVDKKISHQTLPHIFLLFQIFNETLLFAQLVFIVCKPYLWLYFQEGEANDNSDGHINNPNRIIQPICQLEQSMLTYNYGDRK
jgi:hypothetical protein